MGIVTYIDGIPTFSTQLEALAWGRQHGGIQGFHTHIVDEQTTYMAGVNHNAITSRYTTIQNIPAALATPEQLLMVEPVSMPLAPANTTQQAVQPLQQTTIPKTTPTTTTTTPMTTPTTGGGGGGY